MPQPGLEAFFQNIAKYKATISLVFPTMCCEMVRHPGTTHTWEVDDAWFPDRHIFISNEKVRLEDFASSHVRCIRPWIFIVECLPHANTISGGALLSASLIKDIKDKLKNVGADTIILQG